MIKDVQSINLIVTYWHRTSKNVVCKKEEANYNNIIKQYKIFDFDYITKDCIKEHVPNWPEIPDLPCRILIVGDSGSRKTDALLNLINNEPDIDEIYVHAEDPYETKYNLLINKRESTSLKYLNDSNFLIE